MRIVLADGGVTVFSYATSAALQAGFLGVFEWNQATAKLDEIATFRADQFVKADIIRDRFIVSTIPGYAHAPSEAESRSA